MSAWQKITIEDTSDCGTCTQRDIDAFSMLTSVRCTTLSHVTCQECFRTVDVWVEDDGFAYEGAD